MNNTTNIKHQKLSPSVNKYLCFQTDVRNARNIQYEKSRAPMKVVEDILYVVSFEKKGGIIKAVLQ